MSNDKTYDVDDGSVEIEGNHPSNPNEKPIAVPVDGDDGMPIQQEEVYVEKEPITIISETESQRIEDEKRCARKDPADGDDEEVVNEEDDEITKELKRQRNRARREANKDRRRKAAEFKNSEIRKLRLEVAELRANQGTQSHITRLDADQSQIQRLRDESATKLALAEQKLKESFKSGDENAHAEALKEMYAANVTMERADTALRNIETMKKSPPKVEEPVVDDYVQDMVSEFQKKNPWFDPKLGDRDSRRTKRVSEDLLREGYNVTDDDYWAELEERIAEELPHRSGRRQEEERKPQQQPKKLPISNGSGREVRQPSVDGKVSTSDITPMQRSILRQMGYVEGSKDWMEMAIEYKKKNRAAQA